MTKPTRVEICCDEKCPNYGVQQVIELTDAEIAQIELDTTEYLARKAEEETNAQALADLKKSAKAKLIAGEPLTEEEASVLVI